MTSRAARVRRQGQFVIARRQSFERILSSRAYARLKITETIEAGASSAGMDEEAGVFRRPAILKFHLPPHYSVAVNHNDARVRDALAFFQVDGIAHRLSRDFHSLHRE